LNNYYFCCNKIKTKMNKYLSIFIVLAVVSCNDMAKKVDQSSSDNLDLKEEVKPSLSSNLVMNKESSTASSSISKGPQFSFDNDSHDFGQLIDGEKVSYSFKFTNSGDAPLIISSAKGSCGCTVPDWPKDPIEPGQTGTIDISFNSSGRSGKQNKTVTLQANTNPNRKVLRITSEVITK